MSWFLCRGRRGVTECVPTVCAPTLCEERRQADGGTSIASASLAPLYQCPPWMHCDTTSTIFCAAPNPFWGVPTRGIHRESECQGERLRTRRGRPKDRRMGAAVGLSSEVGTRNTEHGTRNTEASRNTEHGTRTASKLRNTEHETAGTPSGVKKSV